MTGELKPLPCPFCGTSNTLTTELDEATGHKWGYAACSCGVRGPDVRTGYDGGSQAAWRVEAITAWNTRPREEALDALLSELVAVVRGECPRLLSEDSGGCGDLALRIEAALSHPKGADE